MRKLAIALTAILAAILMYAIITCILNEKAQNLTLFVPVFLISVLMLMLQIEKIKGNKIFKHEK